MSQIRTLQQLQKELKSTGKKNADKITHTRIGDKDNNIYGGAYIVDEDVQAEWYSAIYKEVIQGNKMEYLTEKQFANGPLYVDLDFHYSTDITTRQHNDDWIDFICAEYMNAIQECCMFEGGEKMKIYVMQKDGVNRLENKTKDGLHILFGVNFPRAIHKLTRKKVMDNVEELMNQLPLINDLEAIFDDGITKGSTNIQVYGCRKPAHEAYKLYKIYNCELDGADMQWCMPSESPQMTPELFWELSVRNLNRPEFPLNDKTKMIIDPLATLKAKKVASEPQIEWENESDIDKLFSCFTIKRINKYETWTQIAWALMNSLGKEKGGPFIEKLNNYCPIRNNASDKQSAREWFDNQEPMQDGVTIKSLHYWAKLDNPDLYANLFPKHTMFAKKDELSKLLEIAITSGTEYDFAKYLKQLSEGKFVCVAKKDKVIYNFTNANLWKKDMGGICVREFISNEVYEQVKRYKNETSEQLNAISEDTDEKAATELKEHLKKRLKLVADISIRLHRTTDKNNILFESCDLLMNDEFLKTMNKAEFKLTLKSGKILNMSTLEVTDRTINDKFDYECDAIYRELKVEEEAEAEAYFSSLFCGHLDTMQVVLNIIKSVMTGRPLRYIYFMIGSGRNGKSVLLNLLDAIFVRAVDVISKDVILKKKSNSHLNTEIEKLDKCRLGYTTELKEEDKLNETTIKQITGGDKINVRGICRTDETLSTTSNLMVITNELPNFDVEPAICDRIIVIPFNNRFEVVDKFKDNIIAKRDVFFSYIMKKGIIQDKFELTPEMTAATNDYKKANDKDYLKEYLEQTYQKTTEFDTQTGKPYKILKSEFRIGWLSWLKGNEYQDNKREEKQVTRRLTKLGVEGFSSNGKEYYINIKPIEFDEDE